MISPIFRGIIGEICNKYVINKILKIYQYQKLNSFSLLDNINFLGTSSPLGELFDHGCDAWAAVFIATTFYNTFGKTSISANTEYSISELRMYGVMWSVFFTFHLSHWEKYNTSVMYLPVSSSEIFLIFKAWHHSSIYLFECFHTLNNFIVGL